MHIQTLPKMVRSICNQYIPQIALHVQNISIVIWIVIPFAVILTLDALHLIATVHNIQFILQNTLAVQRLVLVPGFEPGSTG